MSLMFDEAKIEIDKIIVDLCKKWSIPKPKIGYNVRGKLMAGEARVHFNKEDVASKLEVRFNLKFLSGKNYRRFMDQTVPHEIAHILSYIRHGKKALGHGLYWEEAMDDLGISIEVEHEMNIAPYFLKPKTSKKEIPVWY